MEQDALIRERTRSYIVEHLDPFMWTVVPDWDQIADTDGVDESEVAHAVRQMSYRQFLQTPYWHAVSEEVKRRANGRCAECGAQEDLIVHHLRYRHHGWEHRHLEDLCCLCSSCHQSYHDRQSDCT